MNPSQPATTPSTTNPISDHHVPDREDFKPHLWSKEGTRPELSQPLDIDFFIMSIPLDI